MSEAPPNIVKLDVSDHDNDFTEVMNRYKVIADVYHDGEEAAKNVDSFDNNDDD